MINKYRVHEVAKDFDIKSNIVVDLLAKYFDGQKKHMTALEEDELDVIFETFTKENEVADLNEYFEYMPAPKKVKEAPAEEKAEEPAPAPEKKEEKAEEKKPEKKAEEKKAAPASEKKEEKKPEKKPAQPGRADKLPPMPKKQPKPENKEKDNKPMQSRTKGEAGWG